ncbi:MAG: error-prone DNA polymerase [Mycetocola sp.]
MGFNNPPQSWTDLERGLSRLSGAQQSAAPEPDGGDGPAFSRKRQPYQPPQRPVRDRSQDVPYAELHTHSTFSFLDGASPPEDLVEAAAALGLSALGLTDHNGLYGAVRFAEAAEAQPELGTVYGAELGCGITAPSNGVADPEGEHLLVLARGLDGYHRLAGAITDAQLAEGAQKGAPVFSVDAVADRADGQLLVLTGCRKGAVHRALRTDGEAGVVRACRELSERFGKDNVVVELCDHSLPEDSARNDTLVAAARRLGLPVVATTGAHYADHRQAHLADALAAVRARRSLSEMEGWLPPSGSRRLRSGAEMARRFRRYPGAVAESVRIADEAAFRLRSARPGLPLHESPDGRSAMEQLRTLVWQGASELYPQMTEEARSRIARELNVIERKDFPGYFLIVHDIVRFARSRGILCQGRGSAANSAVCYLLRITAVDSIRYQLPFERFLSTLRDEEPDIDVDFDAGRREEVIQYVYSRYGRRNAAQVANVISYRPASAIRDTAKALGYSSGQQDAWSQQMERYGSRINSEDHTIPDDVVELSEQLLSFPRHLGIHSGGMVLTDRPIGEVCPIEHARMPGRTVLQWDKDDCAWMGLVKFDLLGLGILSALQRSFDLADEFCGERFDLQSMPKEEPAVYDMLCRGDVIGVFQVESRAQMGLLPRLQPRQFYDLVIEIAMIRPGPIQGGAVHPYLRRRQGREPVEYLHPDLEPVLARTLGIPVFQEQLMQMAVIVGGCTGEDADLLRRAMGSKRGHERIESLKNKLYTGMAERGISEADADRVYSTIQAFANFGFAESHSISFALLVYASAWMKLHYPAAFLAALLASQPMGFYSPQSLIADAQRRGVQVLGPDVLRSQAGPTLETLDRQRVGRDSCLRQQDPQPDREPEPYDASAPDRSAEHRRDGHTAVRLGLDQVTAIGSVAAARIVQERELNGPFRDQHDLARRTGLTAAQLEALAAAGVCSGFGTTRRQALWAAGQAAGERPDQLEGTAVVVQPPLFGLLDDHERMVSDLWSMGVSVGEHPVAHLRSRLRAQGVHSVAELAAAEPGRRVWAAGVVTHRQRPATASGITFVNIEDETGLLNVICSPGVWARYRRIARTSAAMRVRGILEQSPEGIINLVADELAVLSTGVRTRSRDFQ